jgi:AraC-like DNA-binding protein
VNRLEIEQAKVLLRNPDLSVADVAGELGISPRSLREHFNWATGLAPKAWRTADGIVTAEGVSPVVSFRLAEYEALVEAAKEAGQTPHVFAKNIVRRALRRKVKRRPEKC